MNGIPDIAETIGSVGEVKTPAFEGGNINPTRAEIVEEGNNGTGSFISSLNEKFSRTEGESEKDNQKVTATDKSPLNQGTIQTEQFKGAGYDSYVVKGKVVSKGKIDLHSGDGCNEIRRIGL
jgi:hypothetical protein